MGSLKAMGWFVAIVFSAGLALGCAGDRPDTGAENASNPPPPAPASASDAAAARPVEPAGAIAAADLVERLGTVSEPVVLDVRSSEEYADGHIPGAINIPYDEIPAYLDSLNAFRGREIVVYCRSGRRAGVAEEALAKAGFGQVFDLEGHMLAWQAEEYPLAVPAADCC
jgi:rhodanese-related sulfurtransferase